MATRKSLLRLLLGGLVWSMIASAPGRADAFLVDLDLVFPSQAILGAFNRTYLAAGVDHLPVTIDGSSWAIALVIPNIELSAGVSYAQLVVNGGYPVSASYNPTTGDLISEDFDIVVTKRQYGNPTPLWTDTIEDFSLTTGSFANVCGGGSSTFTGDPLDGFAPPGAFMGLGDIKLVGAKCLLDFGSNGGPADFNDVRFSLQLFGYVDPTPVPVFPLY